MKERNGCQVRTFAGEYMESNLKVKYFDELFKVFTNKKEGWYAFYADYTIGKVWWCEEIVDYLGLSSQVMDEAEALSEYISLIHPDDREQFIRESVRMKAGEIEELNIPYRIMNKEGKFVTVSTYSKMLREDSEPVFYAGLVVNYEKSNLIDATTGLHTTSMMMEKMNEYNADGKPYFIMLLGIRDFASINNNYGYMEGNRALRVIADIMMLNRNGAEVYKLEGTKFAMLKAFEEGDEELKIFGSKEFENIRNRLLEGIGIKGRNVVIDVYGGGVYTDDISIMPDTVYTSVLFALAKAKDNTSATTLNVFNQSLLVRDSQKLSLYNAIRESIMDECQGFFMVYQPIIGRGSGKLVAMEALLRWYGDEYGQIFPGTFIEWLEKDPIFFDLGSWIIRKSLEDAKKIIKVIPDFKVNINLAYPQLGRDDFEQELKKIVEESGVSPRNIRLELTERCKLLDVNLLRQKLKFIQDMGMQTSLDDFGTGYSSINLLFDLPVNQIKIDRSFIQDIDKEEPKKVMLKAIVDCARILGAHVCVEGLETREMVDYVCDNFDITSMQGYYYSKPIMLEDFLDNMHMWM